MRPRLRTVVVGLLLLGCSGAPSPAPTPADMTGVLAALSARGVTIREVVGNDPGCGGSPLHSNAARVGLTLADGRDYRVYLFRWRRPEQFAAAAQAFGECVAEFAGTASAVNVEVVELRPWRAFGAGWTRELSTTLRDALSAAGGG